MFAAHNTSDWSPASTPIRELTAEQRLIEALDAVLALDGMSDLSLVEPRVDGAELLIATWADSHHDTAGIKFTAHDHASDGRWYRVTQVHVGDRKVVDCWKRIDAPTVSRVTDRSLKDALTKATCAINEQLEHA